MVLLNLPQPVALDNLVANLRQRNEVPKSVCVKRLGVLSTPKEDALHLVEVVLQSVVVLAKHARAQLYLQHVPREFCLGSHLKSACALEHLDVDILANHFDDLRHQAYALQDDVAYLALQDWSIRVYGDHVGDDATNSSFCHIAYVI